MSDSGMTTKSIPRPGSGVVVGNPDAAFSSDTVIEAKPLVGPQFTEVQSKNPNLAFRYVVRSDPGRDPSSRIRYNEALSEGYIPATTADCIVPGLAPTDGHFIKGDLILMKIDRKKYEGALLYNVVRTQRRSEMENIAAATRADINTPGSSRDKISVILPNNAGEFIDQRDKDAGFIPIGPKAG